MAWRGRIQGLEARATSHGHRAGGGSLAGEEGGAKNPIACGG